MRSREEFVRRWKNHLAGLALYGMVSELRDSTLARASRALEIPQEVERLLGAMYDHLAGEKANGANGQGVHRNGVPFA